MLSDANDLTGSTSRLLATFRANTIPCEVVSGRLNLIKYKTKNSEWRLLRGMMSEKLPLFSKQICDNKLWTYLYLTENNLPSPETLEVHSEQDILGFLSKYDQVVVKPVSGAHGHGVTMNVSAESDLGAPIAFAKSFGAKVLAQQQIEGKDIRILVIGGTIVSALERRAAYVIGDGTHTVNELIELENKRSERGEVGVDPLVKIPIEVVGQYLSNEGLASIPDKAEAVRVIGPSNHSMGGSVHDITDSLPLETRGDVETLCKKLQLPIAGVDIILARDGHYFLEVNASPGIGIHDYPALGTKSDCFTKYMRFLYEDEWWCSS